MKKLILFFLMISSFATSECKTDVYFANGILTTPAQARYNAYVVLQSSLFSLYNSEEEYKKNIGKVDYAYNSTLGRAHDMLEAYIQLDREAPDFFDSLRGFYNEFITGHVINKIDDEIAAAKVDEALVRAVEEKDLSAQVRKYEDSIENSGKVLVVAHSQGALFTNRAYARLNKGKQQYFSSVYVAPASSYQLTAKNHTPSFTFHNDPISSLARHFKFPITTNPNLYKKPIINGYNERSWVYDVNETFHAFRYYMGKNVPVSDYDGNRLALTNIGKDAILGYIRTLLNDNRLNCPCSNKSSVSQPITANGAIEVTLSWTCANNVDLNLYLTGNSVEQDIKDVENLGLEHAYVALQSSIHPGDAFVASSTGKKREESQLEESYLEDNPVNIYAVVKTPGGSKFKQYEAQNFGQLTLGEFAAIEVKDKKFETTYSSGGGGSYATPVYTPPYVRTYNECDEKDKKYTCQCVPCEYIIHGMDGAVEYGPIGGAEVEIIRADTYGSTNPVVVYRGKTTNDTDLFKSGLVKFSQSDYAKFEEDVYYVVDAKGGSDLDRDDDLVKDATPTPNNGTIHAIIKGSDLKTVAFRVNALTEAIYQTTGDLLGGGYDSVKLDEKLAQASKKLFREKTFIFNNEININYHDALLWAPGVDKKKLFKPYDTFVEPIVVKTYADAPRVKESYRLIYEKLDTDAPQLTPLAVEIPHTIPNNSIIGKVSIESEGISGIDHIELHGEHNSSFIIDKEGLVKIVDNSILSIDALYKLDMVAVGADTKRGIAMELVVKVIEGVALADPNATVPTLESVVVQDILENSVAGTVVGQANFIDSSLNIVAYTLSGEDNDSFVIDSTGEITVAQGADIDYEKSDTYTVKVSAMNEAGNESFPVRISFKIINEIDTPLHDLVYLTHLSENVPLGTVVGEIVKLREGRSPITSFDILNPNVPFALDVNGTIRTTGYIDYETAEEYNLLAMAKTDSGNGNKVEIQILINDVYPETGKPSLQALSASIDENSHAGVEVGRLNISQGASNVELVELRGTGHSNFSVDVNGTIRVANGATLDYEQKTSYALQAIAHNAHGSSALVSVNIAINNLDDEAPTLLTLTKNIEENATVNTVVGTLRIDSSGEGNITDYTLTGTGAENFSIDENGTIRVSSSANLDYETTPSYTLQATVLNDAGESEPSMVRIYILNVPENPPVLKPLTLSIEENASIGTVVGTVQEDVGGDSPIISYRLTNTEFIDIDSSGTLTLNQDINYLITPLINLQVYASNSAGESNASDINITVQQMLYNGDSTENTLIGSSRDETFDGKGGNDTIQSGGGDDSVTGGKGNDIIIDEGGDDTYHYTLGDGNDTMEDHIGEDILYIHGIQKEKCHYEISGRDMLIVMENNETITLKNWADNDYKIETFMFDDGQSVTVDEFNHPIVKADASIVDLSKLGNTHAKMVVQGFVRPLEGGYDAVDHWVFHYNGGQLIIDMLSELASNGHTYIDIDGDGKQTGLDVYIYLFKKDQNANWMTVRGNDDSSAGTADGSSHSYDSYLSLDLEEGEYMLSVSNYSLSASVALTEKNSAQSYPHGGPYQITFNTALEFSAFPDNANNNLYGSDHYNFYVLRNDLDPYNVDGLRILNPEIFDENGTRSNSMGRAESMENYLSYYPEDAFSGTNTSHELNIVYNVVNQNGIECRSLLSLQIIPDMYMHVDSEVNRDIWATIKEDCLDDLNISKGK